MPTINHLDNFSTNLSSGTSAGATTSPLNTVPSISAPFYMAWDRTNINGHFEVKQVTSKNATNVNHAALTYAHTTNEEVGCVTPATELDTLWNTAANGPQGYLINGKISVTDTGSGLTVAIKTLAGTDPSATDPVYCRIGDTVRTISAALSVTKADGTNWCNAGSAELATKEIDYFVGLGYNVTDGVYIGFTRRPTMIASEMTSLTSTSENYWAGSQSNFGSTDYIENIGRFAATLSAGAGYTWSVPTFTAVNLIQRPIYETRHLIGGSVAGFVVGNASVNTKYKVVGDTCFFRYYISFGSTSSYSTAFNWVLPFTMADFVGSAGPTGSAYVFDNGTRHYVANCRSNANNSVFIFADDAGAQPIANTYPFTFTTGDGVGLDISFRI